MSELSLGFHFDRSLKANYSDVEQNIITDTILLGCACFCQEFQTIPVRKVNFNLYPSIDAMKADGVSDGRYDGSFKFAKEPYPETLSINLKLRKNFLAGCKRLLAERENSVSIADIEAMRKTQQGNAKLVQRGDELLVFRYTMEVILHEFSHAINYEKMMDDTGWTDLDMPTHDPDYFLWDEFLAKYRSMLVSLKMIPTMEFALLFSIYKAQLDALYKDFDETVERLEAKKQELQNFGFSLAELKRSARDVALTQGLIGHYYAFDNSMATYAGTQLMGFIHACYDLMTLTNNKIDKKILTSDEKDLQFLLQKEQPIHKSRILRNFKTKKEVLLKNLCG